MALMKSISGIRGTIGGAPGEGLTPMDVVRYTTAYAAWLRANGTNKQVVLGRDGRISGEMVYDLVRSTLKSMGCDIIDTGLSTTPTIEMAVKIAGAGGGIIVTASHNPRQWNALKFFDQNGEFISAESGVWILEYAAKEKFEYCDIDHLGTVTLDDSYIDKHIDEILKYPLVDMRAIQSKNFNIVIDPINSTGAIAVPKLLKALGVENFSMVNAEVTGEFKHNPEPLPENLKELCDTVVSSGAMLGIAVDPDVDRLCFVCEDGSLFGEEYTLVAVADYVLSQRKGSTVSNLSSTVALKEVTEKHEAQYYAAAVGEVHVVQKMKDSNAVIGGEGNGGVIVPDLHYGRDALIGIALFLTHLAKFGGTVSELRKTYPEYVISKNKINLEVGVDIKMIFEEIQTKYSAQKINIEDGLKIEFENNEWVQLRASNTEPIIRIFAESKIEAGAKKLAEHMMQDITVIIEAKK